MFFIFLIIRQEVPQTYTTNLLSWSESLGINFFKKWVMKNYINFTKVYHKVYIFGTVLQHGIHFSTSNPRIIVPHRDVFWYCLIGMGAKKSFPTFFHSCFKRKLNEVGCKFFRNKNIFQKHNYASPMACHTEYFQTLGLHHYVTSSVVKPFIQ